MWSQMWQISHICDLFDEFASKNWSQIFASIFASKNRTRKAPENTDICDLGGRKYATKIFRSIFPHRALRSPLHPVRASFVFIDGHYAWWWPWWAVYSNMGALGRILAVLGAAIERCWGHICDLQMHLRALKSSQMRDLTTSRASKYLRPDRFDWKLANVGHLLQSSTFARFCCSQMYLRAFAARKCKNCSQISLSI